MSLLNQWKHVLLIGGFVCLIALTLLPLSRLQITAAQDEPCIIGLESDPHHLGDDFSEDWLVPTPEGTSWSAVLDLEDILVRNEPLLLRFEVFHTDSSNVYANGESTAINNGNQAKWDWRGAVMSRPMLMADGNVVKFIAGNSGTDDLMFRNVALIKCFLQVEDAPHHLGDDYTEAFLRPNPEGVSWYNDVELLKPGKNLAMLSLDMSGLDRATILVNGMEVGTLTGSNQDIWQNRTVLFNGSQLTMGANRIEVVSNLDNGWDDFQFKNVRLYYEATDATILYLPSIIRHRSNS